MEKQFNVFIQWHENTNNYRRFDGGLEVIGTPLKTVESANRAAAEYLFNEDNSYFWYPFAMHNCNTADGLQLGAADTNVVIDFNSTELANVDFGDGTIYVAEVVE